MPNFPGILASIKNRLFFLSSFISAGAVASFAASPEQSTGVALSVVLQTLAGVAANLGASEVYDLISKRVTHEDVLRNEDLSKAVRNAIGVVLLAEADETRIKEDRETLRTIANTDPQAWRLVEVLQSDALEEISQENLAEFFSRTPEEFADFKALDPESWRELLRWLEKEHSVARLKSVSLSEETRDRVARKLHEVFPRVLYETLKQDFARDGKAYGGLLLQLVGKIAGVADKTFANTEEILRLLRQFGQAVKIEPALCNLPQRNQFFTGRQNYLDELKDELGANKRAVLSGMPGVGKTQTAVEYAYRQFERKACDYVFYVHAASVEELLADFAAIARHLSLPAKDDPDFNRVAASVKAWFEQNAGWLLIFDNADDLKVLFDDGDTPEERHNYIPANRQGQVLLTRRPNDAGGVARTIEIKEMDTDEGALLLLRRAGYVAPKSGGLAGVESEIATAARKVAYEVGGLPLALDIAGAFIKETPTPPAEYLSLYHEEGKALRQESDEQDPYKHSVATAFSLAFKRVATPDTEGETDRVIARAAADLLRLCAFVAPDAIPLEHFTAGASQLGDDLSRAMTNKLLWAKARKRVLRFALLERNADGQTFDTHRLVQAVIRDEMDAATQCLWVERALRMMNDISPSPEDFSNWSICDLLLSHALECIVHGRNCNIRTTELAQLARTVARHLKNRARYSEAELLHQEELEICKEVLGEHHPSTATTLNHLAALYYAQGRYDEAGPLFKRVLEIMTSALGEEHPHLAVDINNLAELYREQGRYAEAEPLFKKALKIYQKSSDEHHPDVMTSLNNLALLYLKQGRYEEAEPLFKRTLESRRKVLGEQHPNTAGSLNNLAELYRAQGRYNEAEPLYKQALEIRTIVLGERHPDTAEGLNNLALLYYTQGSYDEAEPLYQQALEIRTEVLGEYNPDRATSLNNLALLYGAQGRYDEAELLYKEAVGIQKKVLGEQHPNIATSLSNLAGVYQAQGDYQQAESLYQQALKILTEVLGEYHPSTAGSLNNLAAFYFKQGRYKEAGPLLKRTLEISKKVLGEQHPDIASSLNNLAEFYRVQGQYAKAAPLYQQALELSKKVLGEYHPSTAMSLNNLAALYYSQGYYLQAEPFLRQALEIFEQKLGVNHPHSVLCRNNLAELRKLIAS